MVDLQRAPGTTDGAGGGMPTSSPPQVTSPSLSTPLEAQGMVKDSPTPSTATGEERLIKTLLLAIDSCWTTILRSTLSGPQHSAQATEVSCLSHPVPHAPDASVLL